MNTARIYPYMRFEVVTAVKMSMLVLWVARPRKLLSRRRVLPPIGFCCEQILTVQKKMVTHVTNNSV
jgi:hypothetical protein